MDETHETRRQISELRLPLRSDPDNCHLDDEFDIQTTVHERRQLAPEALPFHHDATDDNSSSSPRSCAQKETFSARCVTDLENIDDEKSTDYDLMISKDPTKAVQHSGNIDALPKYSRPSVVGRLRSSEPEDDLIFQSWDDCANDTELSQSIPLNPQTRISPSQVLTYSGTAANGPRTSESGVSMRESLVNNQPVERSTRSTRQLSSVSSSAGDSHKKLFRFFSRQNSEISPGAALTSRSRGSSIFGSRIFESTSSLSHGESPRIEMVCAASGSVDPTYDIGHYCVAGHDELIVNGALPPQTTYEKMLAYASLSANGDAAARSASFPIRSNDRGASKSPTLPWTWSPNSTSVETTVVDACFKPQLSVGVSEELGGTIDADELSAQRVNELAAATNDKRKWSNVMPDLVENLESGTLTTPPTNEFVGNTPEAERTGTGSALLRRDASHTSRKDSLRKDSQYSLATVVVDERAEKRRYMKNLLVVSISFFLIFTSYLAIRNLQTSLNAAGGLGLYALSSVYGFLFVGSLFSTTIVQRLGPKRSLSVSMLFFVLYNAVNFYPRFYTLVPMSAAIGFFLAVLWTSQATYLTNIAIGYARLTNSRPTDVLSRFNGIFFAFFQTSQIAGGLISSLLLQASQKTMTIPVRANCSVSEFGNQTGISGVVAAFNISNLAHEFDNDTIIVCSETNPTTLKLCGSLYCPGQGPSQSSSNGVDPTIVLILMGIFLASAIIGLLTLVLFLDPLEGIMKKTDESVLNQMTAVFRLLRNRHAVYLAYSFYSLLQVSFMFGEFTKAFVTCSVGIHMVGYTMLTVSLSSAVSSFVTGSIQKYVGRIAINVTGLLIQLLLLVLLFFWESTQKHIYLFFICAGLWGTGDGIIGPQTVSLIGTLFDSNKEVGFAAHKMFQSLSVFVMFITAPYLCTRIRIVFFGCALLIAACGYGTLEVMLKIETKSGMVRTKIVPELDEKR